MLRGKLAFEPMGEDGSRTTVRAEPHAAEPPTADRFYLLVIGDGVVAAHALGASDEIVIGRSVDSAVRIEHASISRRHARLRLGPTPTIEDLGSANGTRVRKPNEPLEVPDTYELKRPDGSGGRNTEVLTFDGEQIKRIEVYFGWDLRE